MYSTSNSSNSTIINDSIIAGIIIGGAGKLKMDRDLGRNINDEKKALYIPASKDLHHYMVIYELKRLIQHDRISVQEVNNILTGEDPPQIQVLTI